MTAVDDESRQQTAPGPATPGSAGFVELLDAVVREAADRLAVVAHGEKLTFRELDRWSNLLAAQILDRVGAGPEPVLIIGGHDIRAAVCMAGVAKTARPLVFVDTKTPVARMKQVSTQAGPAATVVDPAYTATAAELGSSLGAVIELPAAPDGDRVTRPAFPAHSLDDPLAIVFTSGSTGTPKGVILADGPICEEIGKVAFLGTGGERMAVPSPFGFIAGLGGMARSLMVGAEMHLYDPRAEGIADMVDWVRNNAVTTLNLTPHLMRSLAAAAIARGVVFDSVHTISCGTEPLLVSDVEAMRRCTTENCVIINASGSSEGWVVSMLVIDRSYELPATGQVSAGLAAPNRDVYLEAEDGTRITEPGRTGMIMLAARNMSSGYWGNPELTRERFTTDDEGRRVYRTGDLGRWNDKGELQYAGRADHMIKVRGYLVEPAEVEKHLGAEKEVTECVVVGRPGPTGIIQLVAFVVPDPTTWRSVAAIRRRLSGELPGYMVPPVIVELPALPRNPNGKIDRLSLPEQVRQQADPMQEGWNSLQLTIASICSAALGLDDIGLHDSLFELGADSLAVEEILGALKAELDLDLTSAALMEHPTIAELAGLPRGARSSMVDGVLVELAPPGPKRPLFLIAGAAGLALQFRELARQLGADRAVYGLQARGLESPGLPDVTVRAAARRYVRAIRRVQPTGPYNIGGHSLGALLAYEVVRQLQAAGAQVGVLGLLDAMGGDESVSRDQLKRIMPDADPEQLAELKRRRSLGARRGRFGMQFPFLTRPFWRARKSEPFVAYWSLGTSMAHRYQLPEDGLRGIRAISYVAADQPPSVTEWERFISPEPETRMVGGDHLTMLRAPFVNGLAEAMAEALDH